MKLIELIQERKDLSLFKAIPDAKVEYISSDTRTIEPGDIFCIYDSFGEKTPEYINEVLNKKIQTVLIRKNNPHFLLAEKFPNVISSSEDPMETHGYLASLLMGEPSKKLKIIAVTGTNGKTSFTYILGDIIARMGMCGIIGTIQVTYGNRVIHTGYTTPDPSSLNQILKDMVEDDIEYVFIEASSHGLKLGRMNGLQIYGAVFTNLSQDHMDFHIDANDYIKSKFILFQLLESSKHKGKFAVVSTYTSGGKQILTRIKKEKHESYRLITYGKGKMYSGELKELSLSGTSFTLKKKNSVAREMFTNLLGNFNIENVSLAYITAIELGMDSETLGGVLENLKPIDGRFQIVYSKGKNRAAIVDYAHTPDALENVLKSLKEIPHSKLICLFGCGGDRDKGKRPLMGEVASKYSDMIILTSDNPRTEDPEKIIDDIEKGISKTFKEYIRITNRRQAILKGIQILPDKGFLLVAGKGHENYQIIGNSKESFSDTIEVKQAFESDDISRR